MSSIFFPTAIPFVSSITHCPLSQTRLLVMWHKAFSQTHICSTWSQPRFHFYPNYISLLRGHRFALGGDEKQKNRNRNRKQQQQDKQEIQSGLIPVGFISPTYSTKTNNTGSRHSMNIAFYQAQFHCSKAPNF